MSAYLERRAYIIRMHDVAPEINDCLLVAVTLLDIKERKNILHKIHGQNWLGQAMQVLIPTVSLMWKVTRTI